MTLPVAQIERTSPRDRERVYRALSKYGLAGASASAVSMDTAIEIGAVIRCLNAMRDSGAVQTSHGGAWRVRPRQEVRP